MRSCVVCGTSLDDRRSDARHCGGPCRAEAARLRAILSGRGSGPYRSVAERVRALSKRTNRAWRGSQVRLAASATSRPQASRVQARAESAPGRSPSSIGDRPSAQPAAVQVRRHSQEETP